MRVMSSRRDRSVGKAVERRADAGRHVEREREAGGRAELRRQPRTDVGEPRPPPLDFVNPWPLSETWTCSCASVSQARMSILPPSGSGESACLIAFSTSVTSISEGRRASRNAAGTSMT